MLVLSRKRGEKIYIGDVITVTVVDIDRGKMRLGVTAPRNVPVFRQEVLEKLAESNYEKSDSTELGTLILTRKLGQKVFIGENICVTVVDIDRGKIRLGIEAPRDLSIRRGEISPTTATP